MSTLLLVLAITCGFLLMTCLYFATVARVYKADYNETRYLMYDYRDKLIREKQAHHILKNSLKNTK